MNVFALKIIAMITMLVDHIGYIFFPDVMLFRLIGRTAFPIFAFLLSQGFLHTHDKKKYITKIGIAALITEIPFDLTFFDKSFFIEYQNVLVLFFIALTTLTLYEKILKKNKDGYYILILGIITSIISQADYGFLGMVLILAFYFLSKNKDNYKPNSIIIIFSTILFAIAEFSNELIYFNGGVLEFIKSTGFIYLGIIFAGIILSFYNTKLGMKNKIINIIFYTFYPVHIIILYLISNII